MFVHEDITIFNITSIEELKQNMKYLTEVFLESWVLTHAHMHRHTQSQKHHVQQEWDPVLWMTIHALYP